MQLGTQVDQIITHNKMLETQISQVAQNQAPQTIPEGQFPGQPQPNPRGQANAISLWSETAYEGPQNPAMSESKTSKENMPTNQEEEP